MKKHYYILILLFSLAFGLQNCATCDDCEVVPASKQVLVKNAGGDNLIFGANAIYDPKNIELRNSSGSLLEFVPNNSDGTIDFSFDLGIDTYFLKLDNNDTDTISFTYGKDKHIDCCKEFDVTASTSVNGKITSNTDKITILK